MSSEGKLSRARSKALGSDMDPAPPEPPLTNRTGIAGLARAPRAPRAAKPGFRKVRGRHGDIADTGVLVHDGHGEVAAQLRGLRGRILALNKGKPPCVITVSSGSRAEGKTTISLNLALALSEIDAGPVLLLDGDMLRPNVHRVAGIDMDEGLRSILENGLDLNDRVYETSVPNLDVIPTRPVTEAHESESPLHLHCGRLMAMLRGYYKFVIVDTPPVLIGSQACAFGKHSDGVILVARIERTSRHVVKRAAVELDKAGAKVIGCVLNQQKHHVPDIIYRFLGTTPSRYYRYGYKTAVKGREAAPDPEAQSEETVESSTQHDN